MAVRIMGIINTSPDSFAGDGVDVGDRTRLREHLQKAIDEGADILDIGGQSTRPGAKIIDEQAEIERVVPAIQLARELSDLPVSIDTFKPAVAREALAAGATLLNDISGGSDPQLVQLAREADCDLVIMHMRGTPQTMSRLTDYPEGVVAAVKHFFEQRTVELMAAGIARERIIIDPGIGFAKTAVQSFALTQQLDALVSLGFRVLYGASNKSFLGKALAGNDHPAPVEDRAVATTVVQSYAMLHGASIIRAHDVRAAVQTRTIVEALRSGEEVV